MIGDGDGAGGGVLAGEGDGGGVGVGDLALGVHSLRGCAFSGDFGKRGVVERLDDSLRRRQSELLSGDDKLNCFCF